MINVGRVVNSRNFAPTGGYVVNRKSGEWVGGRWVENEYPLNMTGTVVPAGPEELNQVPEGDRVTGSMCFFSQQPIYKTRPDNQGDEGATSDQIEWQGGRYRIVSVTPWQGFGYCMAIGVRMAGV